MMPWCSSFLPGLRRRTWTYRYRKCGQHVNRYGHPKWNAHTNTHTHTHAHAHTHNQHIHTQHIHTQHTQHNTDTPHNTVLLTDFARNCFAIIVQWLLLNLAILQLHRQLLPVLCTIQLNLDVGRLAKPEKVLGTKQTTPQTDTNQTKSIHSHQPQRSSASINHTPVLLQDQVSFFSHSP